MVVRDAVVSEITRLLDLQNYRGYKTGWVWHELQCQFQFFSFEELKVIATGLHYNPRWASHKWREQEEKRRYRAPESGRDHIPEPEPPLHPLQSCLDLLGIKPPFTIADLKKAYRHLSLLTHPDTGGNQESFFKVTEAYETLKPWAKETT